MEALKEYYMCPVYVTQVTKYSSYNKIITAGDEKNWILFVGHIAWNSLIQIDIVWLCVVAPILHFYFPEHWRLRQQRWQLLALWMNIYPRIASYFRIEYNKTSNRNFITLCSHAHAQQMKTFINIHKAMISILNIFPCENNCLLMSTIISLAQINRNLTFLLNSHCFDTDRLAEEERLGDRG